MADLQILLDTLATFAKDLTSRYGISDVLHDLAEHVTAVLDLAGAGVSLLQDGRVQFVTAPNDAIIELERVQERTQAGPCVESIRSCQLLVITDVTDEAQTAAWPEYRQQARQAGIRAVVGVPMLAQGKAIGALDLYASSPREWSAEDLKVARSLTDIATSYVVHASELEQQQRITEQLQQALESRIIIEQAKGVVAATNHVSIDEAFKLLRRHARVRNAKLHDVASAVVSLGLRINA